LVLPMFPHSKVSEKLTQNPWVGVKITVGVLLPVRRWSKHIVAFNRKVFTLPFVTCHSALLYEFGNTKFLLVVPTTNLVGPYKSCPPPPNYQTRKCRHSPFSSLLNMVTNVARLLCRLMYRSVHIFS
jgi:hypothetical protein